MKAAILHYHLGVGGVSAVIAAQSRAMSRAGVEHLVYCGDPVDASADGLPVERVPELGYQDGVATGVDWEILAAQVLVRMREAARQRIGGEPEVWHAHNSALARHPLLPHLVALLARAGERLWIHVHDFAEDGRPQYLAALGDWRGLYPYGARIRYRFLNRRDRDRLVRAGLPESCAEVIANPVDGRFFAPVSRTETQSQTDLESTTSRRWLLYPVRGIRRKNLGEVLLLASQLPENWGIAVTQPPKERTAATRHDVWQRLAAEFRLPVEFGAVGRLAPCPGAGTGIETWREVPDIWLSTSVEEGFGMMFAEARILGKPVIGRKLAHLEEIGVLNWGYDRLLVPVDWVGRDALNCWREQAWWALLQAHGHRAAAPPEPAQKCQSIMQKAGEEETHVDFGNLPELLQQRVLIHLQAFPEDAKQVLAEFQPQRSLEDSNEPQGQPLPLQEWLQFGLGHLGSPGTDPFRTGTDLFQPEARGWLTEDEFWHAIQGAEENHDAGMELLEQTPGGVGWLDARKVLEECLWGMDQGAADGTERNGKQQPFHFLLAPGLDEGGLPDFHDAEAVIFDVYGTLLQGKPGGVRQDNRVDVMLNALLARLGHRPVAGLTSLLEIEVRRRHLESGRQHPEIDLRDVWRTVLGWQHPLEELDAWVVETETIWHPVEPMPGAFEVVETLAQRGCVLGLLSNAQCNTRHELEPIFGCFHPGLTVFSYHYGTAKPGRELYQELVNRLHSMGIRPENAWMIGNDPLHDIIPAANMGFRTALFTGSGSSLRRGWAVPTCRFGVWECG